MKKSQKPKFTAAQLLRHQQENGFGTYDFCSSREQLAQNKATYTAKRAVYQALTNAINEGMGELTVQTQAQNVRVLVDMDTMYLALKPVLENLQKDLERYERWILEQAAHVEAGRDACGLDASDEQWAVASLLGELPIAGTPAAPVVERCPLLPEPTLAGR